MNFYIIYDNLYEEFQQPFCLKTDTIAKEEFLTFKKGLLDKAQTNEEKNKINTRFFLYKFEGVKFTKDDNDAKINDIKAEPIEWGGEDNE